MNPQINKDNGLLEKRRKSRRRKVTRGRCSLTIAQIKDRLNDIIDLVENKL